MASAAMVRLQQCRNTGAAAQGAEICAWALGEALLRYRVPGWRERSWQLSFLQRSSRSDMIFPVWQGEGWHTEPPRNSVGIVQTPWSGVVSLYFNQGCRATWKINWNPYWHCNNKVLHFQELHICASEVEPSQTLHLRGTGSF